MQITSYLTQLTGLSIEEQVRRIAISEKEDGGGVTVTRWDVPDVAAPSDDDLAKALAKSEPAVTAPVPTSVTSAQAKIQLLRTPSSADGKANLLEEVSGLVQAAGGEVAIWFTEARTWERGNPYVASLSSELKMTSNQVDDLFIAAAKIEA